MNRNGAVERLRGWPARFLSRHDEVGLARQARMATLLIAIDIIVVSLTLLTTNGQSWAAAIEPGSVRRLEAFAALNLILLLLSADLPAFGRALFSVAGPSPTSPASFGTIQRYRPFAFYPAVYLNVLLLAALCHITGGLSQSPYTSIVYALLLLSQQFSRYRRQAGYYLLLGVLITVGLVAWDWLDPHVLAEPVPPALVAEFTIGSFGFTALMNQLIKPGNPRSIKTSPLPTSGAVYRDPEGRWRKVLFSDGFTVDPPVLPQGADTPPTVEQARLELESSFRMLHGDDLGALTLRWRVDQVQPESSQALFVDL